MGSRAGLRSFFRDYLPAAERLQSPSLANHSGQLFLAQGSAEERSLSPAQPSRGLSPYRSVVRGFWGLDFSGTTQVDALGVFTVFHFLPDHVHYCDVTGSSNKNGTGNGGNPRGLMVTSGSAVPDLAR